ncbi:MULTISPECIES: cysteine--tRNA ligase [unclassified Planococcus (in: firmicutes)]|uniref:cysteine--tRNA ligase n=1 Tax=unclassified Planococcus (in: firmicutes) TaxID=2662419 RepID=UPI000C33A023|nr:MULTISPECIES: cysteine--tRNA ligase [unclassified Planococcus (in: firmicutes)]AUD12589.1 cysteine--tRNA ligase [Planococcus sp. MB-3u-03]PKG44575.1 cysteine--tRNA ligase [Planococcus sp. Urea-trap-24]PKG91342.1 cysteine--tRNA ligase [Planococcus sp. Urea-3u-39]PKH35964.1 cysteine--tRNA ligase [Planococcus sp. MB-3u-09]
MSIQIFNSLTRQKEAFVPLEEGKVKMYVCGPTVYNYIHIGNARPVIVYDTVRRYLEYRGYDVKYVSNFTDVDDKLIKAANELGEEVPEIAERFITAYFDNTKALGCAEADVHPRVTGHMPQIVEFIEALIEKGYAYESQGDVYYHTRKFDGYGKLSHQSVDELKIGARIEAGDKKQDALDFVLWKAAKPGEISWESPWGKGRPGWHIECSVMAREHLGDTIDIHAGGQDLTFPHHENEIAQSEAYTGKPFARYWMHNGYINIENEKMSKSLNNFVLVNDILKELDPQVLRLFMLSVHYRHPINYSKGLVEDAKAGMERIRTAYGNVKHRLENSAGLGDHNDIWLSKIEAIKQEFIETMDDDFNTANAISKLFDLSKLANTYLLEKQTAEPVLQTFIDVFDELAGVLGLPFAQTELLDAEIEALLEERIQARKNRDFARSDEIRDQLKEQNIILEDTAQGMRWKRG